MDDFAPESDEQALSIRDRAPDYAAVFGVGVAGSFAVGGIIWLISDVAFASAVGYTMILYGVVLMLAGGATGGGYTNLGVGAVGAMFGARRADEAQDELDERRGGKQRVDPQERLRRGLRPEANPRAFWQVIGGIAYVALGLGIIIILS